MVPSLIPAEAVVQALVQDQPLAVDQTDYNLDIKASNTHLRIEANIYTQLESLVQRLSHGCDGRNQCSYCSMNQSFTTFSGINVIPIVKLHGNAPYEQFSLSLL